MIGLFALVAARGGVAQGETHTNAYLKATFTLTAYVQESNDTNSPVWTTSTRKFGNAEIVQALAAELGLPTNDLSQTSLILLARDVLSNVPTNYHLDFYLRSPGGDVNASTNLQLAIPNGYPTITSSRTTPYGRSTNLVEMTFMEFYLQITNTADTFFYLKGPLTLNSLSLSSKQGILNKNPFTKSINTTVAGTGTIGGKAAVFKGTVKASSPKVEIVEE